MAPVKKDCRPTALAGAEVVGGSFSQLCEIPCYIDYHSFFLILLYQSNLFWPAGRPTAYEAPRHRIISQELHGVWGGACGGGGTERSVDGFFLDAITGCTVALT